MAIVLVRHGETALNAARTLQPPDTPLSDRGLRQAEALARRLADDASGVRVAAILSSDLARAWRTAAAVAGRCGLPVEASALLHERNFGTLRGQRYDLLDFDPLTMDAAPPGGESAAAFAQRAHAAFELMLERHAALDGDLLVVAHGLLIRVLLAGPLMRPAAELQGLQLANTSVSIFDAAAPHALRLLNCTAHLDAEARDDPRSLVGG